jgi:hypothetical protein
MVPPPQDLGIARRLDDRGSVVEPRVGPWRAEVPRAGVDLDGVQINP